MSTPLTPYQADAAARAHKLLVDYVGQNRCPDAEAFKFLIADIFDDYDFEYLARLTIDDDHCDWHVVTVGEGAGYHPGKRRKNFSGRPSIRDLRVFISLARSLEAAIAIALDAIEHTGTAIGDVLWDKQSGALRFNNPDGLMAFTISRVTFDSNHAGRFSRVEESLKRCRLLGDSARAVKQLSKLPGLEKLVDSSKPANGPEGGALIISVKNQVAVLKDALHQSFSVEVKQHQAQELLAELAGLRSWQHLIALVDKPRCLNLPVVVVHHEFRDDHGEVRTFLNRIPEAMQFYRTAAEGLSAFASAVKSISSSPIPIDYIGPDSDRSCPDLRAVHGNVEIWVGALRDVVIDDTYLAAALKAIQHPGGPHVALKMLLGIGQTTNAGWTMTGEKMRVGQGVFMYSGRWRFTTHQNHGRTNLIAQKFSDNLSEVLESVEIETITAQIRVVNSGKDQYQAILMGHYGRVIVSDITDVKVQDLMDLSSMSGIRIVEGPLPKRHSYAEKSVNRVRLPVLKDAPN